MVSPSAAVWRWINFVVNMVKSESSAALAALGSAGASAHVDPGLLIRWL